MPPAGEDSRLIADGVPVRINDEDVGLGLHAALLLDVSRRAARSVPRPGCGLDRRTHAATAACADDDAESTGRSEPGNAFDIADDANRNATSERRRLAASRVCHCHGT